MSVDWFTGQRSANFGDGERSRVNDCNWKLELPMLRHLLDLPSHEALGGRQIRGGGGGGGGGGGASQTRPAIGLPAARQCKESAEYHPSRHAA